MTCACGTEARFVVNGIGNSLQYWYCDTCKDEAKASILNQLTVPDGTLNKAAPMVKAFEIVKSVSFGRSYNSTYDTCDIKFHNGNQLYTFCDLMTQKALQKHLVTYCKTSYVIEVNFLSKDISYTDVNGNTRLLRNGYYSP